MGSSFRIEVLEDVNYMRWRMQMKTVLIARDLMKYVDGSFPCPEAGTSGDGGLTEDEAVTYWMNSDEKAKAYIILTLSASDWKRIQNCKTSHEVWLKLEEMYEPKGLNTKAELMKELTSIKMDDVQDVHDIRSYVQYFFYTVNKLRRMNVEINEELLSIMLLKALPDSFENFRRIIESRDKLPALYDLGVKITDEGLMMDFYKTPEESKSIERSSNMGSIPNLDVLCEEYSKPNSNSTLRKFIGSIRNPCWFLDTKMPYHCCSSVQIARVQAPSSLKYNDVKIDPEWMKFHVPGTLTICPAYYEGTITIGDIMHMPELNSNILSVSKLTDMGYKVIFESTHARIVDNNGFTVMIADRLHEFYFIYEDTYKKGTYIYDVEKPKKKWYGIPHRLKNWLRKLSWR